jgi:hypothetical protein
LLFGQHVNLAVGTVRCWPQRRSHLKLRPAAAWKSAEPNGSSTISRHDFLSKHYLVHIVDKHYI